MGQVWKKKTKNKTKTLSCVLHVLQFKFKKDGFRLHKKARQDSKGDRM